MALNEPKISKQPGDVITSNITFTIPKTLEENQEDWKCYMPECHYGSIQDWIVDHLWYKEISSVEMLFDKRKT